MLVFTLASAAREGHVGGRVVGRVAAEDEQRLDAPGVHLGDERLERLDVGSARRRRRSSV